MVQLPCGSKSSTPSPPRAPYMDGYKASKATGGDGCVLTIVGFISALLFPGQSGVKGEQNSPTALGGDASHHAGLDTRCRGDPSSVLEAFLLCSFLLL